MRLCQLVLLLVCVSALPAHAHVYCVGTAAELTAALNSADTTFKNEDNEVDIKHGTYFGNWDYAITNSHSIAIRGGYYAFFSGCAADSQPDPTLTVLDANGSGTVLSIVPQPGVATNGAVTIAGLTIAHGGESVKDSGAGLFVGFIALYTGDVLIERNILRDNTNKSSNGGGAGLTASIGGVLTVRNNLFYGNYTNTQSAMSVFNSAGHAYISNNTIVYNPTKSAVLGAVVYSGNGSAYAVLTNNIIAFNSLTAADIVLNSQMLLIDNDIGLSNGTPDPTSINTMSVDPAFVDPVAGNFRLLRRSPLIDIGNDTSNSLLGGMSAYDLDGNTRVVGAAIDLGAYEEDVIFANGFGP